MWTRKVDFTNTGGEFFYDFKGKLDAATRTTTLTAAELKEIYTKISANYQYKKQQYACNVMYNGNRMTPIPMTSIPVQDSPNVTIINFASYKSIRLNSNGGITW